MVVEDLHNWETKASDAHGGEQEVESVPDLESSVNAARDTVP